MKNWMEIVSDIKFSPKKIRNKLISSLVFIALIYNLSVSWKVFSNIPLSDPAAYPAIAEASRFFYDTGIREPVQIYIVKFFMLLGLNDILSVRVSTSLVVAFFGAFLCFFRRFFLRFFLATVIDRVLLEICGAKGARGFAATGAAVSPKQTKNISNFIIKLTSTPLILL